MPVGIALTLAWPACFAAAATLGVITILLALIRRVAMPLTSRALILLGIVALTLAAGGLTCSAPRVGSVAVVVDTSPSTRGARYHDLRELSTRLKQLLGDTKFDLYRLSDGVDRAKFEDIGSETWSKQTVYTPPSADIVVMFSDGQFDLPVNETAQAAPTYIVVDPALNDPKDTAIERLEFRDGIIAATVRNTDGPRKLTFSRGQNITRDVPMGSSVITAPMVPDGGMVTAMLRGSDAWRENDAMMLRALPPRQFQRWWIGSRTPPDGWMRMDVAQLPGDAEDYLAAAVIVIDTIAADDFSRRQRELIEQYVRDLGGGLVIVGGDRAFAAGGYAGSSLERLSPLASDPPKPTTHWVLLADSSGSMSAALGDNTRWNFAATAMMQTLSLLPPDDVVSIGNFAEQLRWWRGARPARELQAGLAVPTDIRPHGPTNLGPALRSLAQTTDPAVPTQVLLITDAQTKIDDPAALIAELRHANVHVHLLASDPLPADNVARLIAEQTGGSVMAQIEPRQWTQSLRALLRTASPSRLERSPLAVTFNESAPAIPSLIAPLWNHTWLKPNVTELASGASADGRVPAAAAWLSGTGAVISVAFPAAIDVVNALADRVAMPPRDPRFKIAWDNGPMLRVTIDAANGSFLNNLSPQLQISSDDPAARTALAIPQTAPGRYELSIPGPSSAAFASVMLDGRLIDRIALPGRYPREFDRLGNNRSNMEALARATSGAVIESSQTAPIDLRWPTRMVPLASYFAAAGFLSIASGLLRWRAR